MGNINLEVFLMSRSTKKHGFVKDGGKHGKGVKFAKARANKKVRRSTDEMPVKSKHFRKMFQTYNIHDFVLDARPKGSEPKAYKDWMK